MLSERIRPLRGVLSCTLSKKRQGLSTKTERGRQEVAEEIRYIATTFQSWNKRIPHVIPDPWQ